LSSALSKKSQQLAGTETLSHRQAKREVALAIERFVTDFTSLIQRRTNELVSTQLNQRGLLSAKRIQVRSREAESTRSAKNPPQSSSGRFQLAPPEFDVPLRASTTPTSKRAAAGRKRKLESATSKAERARSARAAQLSLDFDAQSALAPKRRE
jgi:hypothetical protein